jgi:hypothetical protein
VTVGDLQKYLRSLADAIGAAKGPAKELDEAVRALGPFAKYKMADFARFLAAVEDKYGQTGELPDGKPPPKPKPEKVTADQLALAIADIKARLARREAVDRVTVTSELAKFEALKKPELERVVKEMGYQNKPKTKPDALAAITDRLLAGATAAARADV